MHVADLFYMLGIMLYHVHNCKNSFSDVICDISETHRLNNIGPNIEPCGIPNSDVKRVEKLRQFVQNAVEKLNNSLSNIKSLSKS